MYMSWRASAAEAAVGRVTDLEMQRFVVETRASELEDALNVKSRAVEGLMRSNNLLREEVLCLREDLELSGCHLGDLEEKNV